jgi:hypothetical protein
MEPTHLRIRPRGRWYLLVCRSSGWRTLWSTHTHHLRPLWSSRSNTARSQTSTKDAHPRCMAQCSTPREFRRHGMRLCTGILGYLAALRTIYTLRGSESTLEDNKVFVSGPCHLACHSIAEHPQTACQLRTNYCHRKTMRIRFLWRTQSHLHRWRLDRIHSDRQRCLASPREGPSAQCALCRPDLWTKRTSRSCTYPCSFAKSTLSWRVSWSS